MIQTKHACIRASQRGILRSHLFLLMEHGSFSLAPGGLEKITMTKKDIHSAISNRKKEIQVLSKLLGLTAIVDGEGILTVYKIHSLSGGLRINDQKRGDIMAYTLHQQLYDDLKNSGEFDIGGSEQNYVCLTKHHSQQSGNKTRKRVCFVLYGPRKNFAREVGSVHIREDFWNDSGLMKEKEKMFHEDAYALFHLIHHLLRYEKAKYPDTYGRQTSKNWLMFEVEEWEQFSPIVRNFNRL